MFGALFTGGKAFGLLKTQQEEKLNSINEVGQIDIFK